MAASKGPPTCCTPSPWRREPSQPFDFEDYVEITLDTFRIAAVDQLRIRAAEDGADQVGIELEQAFHHVSRRAAKRAQKRRIFASLKMS